MNLKTLSLLSFLSAATALPHYNEARQTLADSFTVMAARSASPIHFLSMNARGGHFWLGGKTSSYCPEQVEEIGGACPPGKETAFFGERSLAVEVPGGQQIYVDAHGALSFTVPHSGYIPPGSSMGPFEHTPGNPIGHWTYKGQGTNGFMACPVPVNGTADVQKSPQWQVYAALQNATVPSGRVGDCLGFDAMAIQRNSSDAAAWEYL
ncbi:hypothetical protein BDV59DRAFT_197571 [Aspergillus ambiguus]|uniref:putative IgE-binding protein n=1 Tax=Aspergillus ambiguus TaxID=176160 RepID=UPI003CCDAE63